MKRLITVLRATRFVECIPFCGVTLLGGLLSSTGNVSELDPALIFTVAGIFFLASFAFAFNNLQDLEIDRQSQQKSGRPLVSGSFSVGSYKIMLAVFALLSLGLLAIGTSWPVLAAGSATILMSWLYSWRRFPFKTVPILSSLLHFVEGSLAFAIGCWSVAVPDLVSLEIGAYFGLVFAAGHLHHEVMDYDADKRCGIRTQAVRFGAKPILWIGFGLWWASAAWFSYLAWQGLVPATLGWIQLGMFASYLTGFIFIAKAQADPVLLKTLQLVYRLTYLAGGLGMLAVLLWERV
jgi:4-hydroxybenzoate polyprenyltransferase